MIHKNTFRPARPPASGAGGIFIKGFFLSGSFALVVFLFSFFHSSNLFAASPMISVTISSLLDAYKDYITSPPTTPLVVVKIPPTTIVAPISPIAVPPKTTPATKIVYVQGPQGPVGPQGPAGLQGLRGDPAPINIQPSSSAAIPSFPANVGIIQPNPATNFSGATLFGVTDLSSNNFTTNNANITTLKVSGDSTITGSLNVTGPITGIVTGTINPGLTLGSVFFQGASGLAQDNANLFWDDTNNRLGIGTNTPLATSILDLTSTTKGFLGPRMTTAERDAITSPATGLLIYNTTTNTLNVYNGTTWGAVGGGGGDNITVNSSAAADTNFLDVTATGSIAGTAWTLVGASTPDDITLAVSVASDTIAGVVDTNTQTFAGNKTFTGNTSIAQIVQTTGSPSALTVTGGAHTTLTASTEATDINFNLARTVQFTTGALTTQRAMRIQAPTYDFVGASTITNAFTTSISGAPAEGTSATITNSHALNIEAGAATGATNSYGLTVNAQTGATNNYAAVFLGGTGVGIGTAAPGGVLHVEASTSQGESIIGRTTTSSGSSLSSINVRLISTNNTTDGFGPMISFEMRDTSGTTSELGRLGYVRAGADNTGDFIIKPAIGGTATERFRVSSAGNVTLSQGIQTTGSPTALTVTAAAHTTLTASTEATDINFNLARTVQFATGALATQRAMRIQAPTYGFVAASVLTNAATLSISGAPIAGTNATITNPAALVVESGNVGIGIAAPTKLLHVRGDQSEGIAYLERITSSTNVIREALLLESESTGVTADGFGTGILFKIHSNGSSSFDQARISAVRDGGITSGALVFETSNASSMAQRMRISAAGNITTNQAIQTTGSPTGLLFTGGAHTTLTASTEATDVNFNLARTVQFATGALATQRAMRIQAPTYGFVGASTITSAATLSISGAPIAGTNATLTNTAALVVESGNVGIGTLAPVGPLHVATASPASATAGSLVVGATFAGGDSDGQMLAVNGPAGFAGNIMSLSNNGTLQLEVRANGDLVVEPTAAGSSDHTFFVGGGNVIFHNSNTFTGSGNAVVIQPNSISTSSGVRNLFKIKLPDNTSATGGAVGLVIDKTGSGTGSGSRKYIDLQLSGVSQFSVDVRDSSLALTPTARTTGSPSILTVIAPADTTLTASTEATDINFNLARTVEFATGALATQRAMRIQAPTYAFVGASTITNAATLSISGAPIAGTNATIDNAYALNVEAGNINLGTDINATQGIVFVSNLDSGLFYKGVNDTFYLNTLANAMINLDSNNNDTTSAFTINTNTNTDSGGTTLLTLTEKGSLTLTQPVNTSGSPTQLLVTGGAHTTLAASTEATDINFNLARTVQFATGALATQRAMRIQAPTYGFVAASVLTNAATLSISGAPIAGTNATITNPAALVVESGNVGIGTAAPQEHLHVFGSGAQRIEVEASDLNSAAIKMTNTSGSHGFFTLSGALFMYDYGDSAYRFTVDTNGSFGIGTNSPVAGAGLTIAPSARTSGSPSLLTVTGPADTTLTASTEATDVNFNLARTVQFATGALATQRAMRIQAPTYGFVAASTITNAATFSISGAPIAGTNATITNPAALVVESGNVGIGTVAPLYALDVLAGGTGIIARFNSTNSTGCTLADGGTITCTSDERMKKNIENINYGLDTVIGLRPVLFNWKYEKDDTAKSLGFIAQEIEALVPKLIFTDEEGMKSLNTTGMIPILTKAIQELNLKITDLQTNSLSANTGSLADTLGQYASTFFNSVLIKVENGIAFMKDIVVEKLTTKELCLEDVCINKDQLKELLDGNNIGNPTTCTAPQTLINNVCTDPVPEPPVPDPEIVTPEP